MMTFYLVRHGNKEAIPFDPPLTPAGVRQAEITAEFLKDLNLLKIIASPKLRTQQTAKILADPHKLEIAIDVRLAERLEWRGNESFNQFIQEWSKTDLDKNYQPSTGDSSIQKGNKMRDILDQLHQKHKRGDVLLVTHGGAIGDLLRNLFGEEKVAEEIDPITGVEHIQIAECSITVVENDGQGYHLLKVNDTSHLSQPYLR